MKFSTRWVASGLSFAVVMTAPGLGGYQALAETLGKGKAAAPVEIRTGDLRAGKLFGSGNPSKGLEELRAGESGLSGGIHLPRISESIPVRRTASSIVERTKAVVGSAFRRSAGGAGAVARAPKISLQERGVRAVQGLVSLAVSPRAGAWAGNKLADSLSRSREFFDLSKIKLGGLEEATVEATAGGGSASIGRGELPSGLMLRRSASGDSWGSPGKSGDIRLTRRIEAEQAQQASAEAIPQPAGPDSMAPARYAPSFWTQVFGGVLVANGFFPFLVAAAQLTGVHPVSAGATTLLAVALILTVAGAALVLPKFFLPKSPREIAADRKANRTGSERSTAAFLLVAGGFFTSVHIVQLVLEHTVSGNIWMLGALYAGTAVFALTLDLLKQIKEDGFSKTRAALQLAGFGAFVVTAIVFKDWHNGLGVLVAGGGLMAVLAASFMLPKVLAWIAAGRGGSAPSGPGRVTRYLAAHPTSVVLGFLGLGIIVTVVSMAAFPSPWFAFVPLAGVALGLGLHRWASRKVVSGGGSHGDSFPNKAVLAQEPAGVAKPVSGGQLGALPPAVKAKWEKNLQTYLISKGIQGAEVRLYTNVPTGILSGPNVILVRIPASEDAPAGGLADVYKRLDEVKADPAFSWLPQIWELRLKDGKAYRTAIPFSDPDHTRRLSSQEARALLNSLSYASIDTYKPAGLASPGGSSLEFSWQDNRELARNLREDGWVLYQRDGGADSVSHQDLYARWEGAVPFGGAGLGRSQRGSGLTATVMGMALTSGAMAGLIVSIKIAVQAMHALLATAGAQVPLAAFVAPVGLFAVAAMPISGTLVTLLIAAILSALVNWWVFDNGNAGLWESSNGSKASGRSVPYLAFAATLVSALGLFLAGAPGLAAVAAVSSGLGYILFGGIFHATHRFVLDKGQTAMGIVAMFAALFFGLWGSLLPPALAVVSAAAAFYLVALTIRLLYSR